MSESEGAATGPDLRKQWNIQVQQLENVAGYLRGQPEEATNGDVGLDAQLLWYPDLVQRVFGLWVHAFTLNPERTKSGIFSEARKFVEMFNDPSNEKCLRDLFYFFGGKWT